ncbi:MAG: hypothetical protein B7Z40_00895 [Bosea sp. 12-68-7]|nr:MAG: hypothetical protein B7Z40_00895 [Bosea sp. 12-68-7]
MTAINLYASGPRGLLVTDTAAYDDDGMVHSFVSKSLAIPRLRMALATRGMIAMLPALAARIDLMSTSFDHLIDEGSEAIAQWFADLDHDDAMEREFELSAVGWSESRKAVIAIQMASIDIPGRAAFQWSGGAVLIGPNPPMEDLVAAGVLVNGIFDERDIEQSLLKVMEIQRSYRVRLGTDPSLPERHCVGGQAIVTEITESGVSQRIARTRPDRVGEHIEPAPPSSAVVVPMSREQQRRLDKMGRRAARAR